MPWHRSKVVCDKDATLPGSQSEHVEIAHSLRLRRTGGKEVDCRLATEAARDDRVMKIGVRQKADYGTQSSSSTTGPLQANRDLARHSRIVAGSENRLGAVRGGNGCVGRLDAREDRGQGAEAFSG